MRLLFIFSTTKGSTIFFSVTGWRIHNRDRHHLEITVFAVIWNTSPSGGWYKYSLPSRVLQTQLQNCVAWIPPWKQCLEGPSQGRRGKCDPMVPKYFLLNHSEDASCRWCSYGMPSCMGQGRGITWLCRQGSLTKLTWKSQKRLEPHHISISQAICWGAGGGCGVSSLCGWAWLSADPPGFVISLETSRVWTAHLSSSSSSSSETSPNWPHHVWAPGPGWWALSRCLLTLGLWHPSSHIWGVELGGSFPQEVREAGWVWSQGLQLFRCRGKLHLHPEPTCGGAGGRDGPSLKGYPPCEGFCRVFKCRLQKSFWFVDTRRSSLKESNPSSHPPRVL